jgi:hypothetical protein
MAAVLINYVWPPWVPPLRRYTGATFKASVMKKVKEVDMLATNCHIQRIKVAVDSPEKPGAAAAAAADEKDKDDKSKSVDPGGRRKKVIILRMGIVILRKGWQRKKKFRNVVHHLFFFHPDMCCMTQSRTARRAPTRWVSRWVVCGECWRRSTRSVPQRAGKLASSRYVSASLPAGLILPSINAWMVFGS